MNVMTVSIGPEARLAHYFEFISDGRGRDSRAMCLRFNSTALTQLYKKHLSMLARYRIPFAWKVRDLELRNAHPERFVGIIKDEGDSHLGDLIEDRGVVSPAEAVLNINLQEKMESVLKTLTPREEQTIKMRFGLGDGSEHTLGEVGERFSVIRERIRQTEAKALCKLRHPSRSRMLTAFLEGSLARE